MDARQRKLEKRIRSIFEESIPFNRLLGLKMISIDPELPHCRFAMREELIGNPTRGILRGGVISAVLDVIAGFSIHLALLAQHGPKEEIHFPYIATIDLRVDYLRPGRGKWFDATARVVRMGRRIAVMHMELRNDSDDLIATGSAAYVVG